VTGYQRIRAVLRGASPDRVPVMLHNFMMAARRAGYTLRQFRESPEAVARSFIRAVEEFDYDGILLDIDTATLAGALGVPLDFPEDLPARVAGPCLRSLAEVDDLAPPDIRASWKVRVWLEAARLLKRHFADTVFLRGNCDQAPFSLAGMMRSTEGWLLDLTEPELEEPAHRLLDYCARAGVQFIQAMIETGAHMVSNGDSLAGPDMVSPRIYRQFALPYEKKLVAAAHAAGFPYALHICGKTDLILEDMLSTGADALELDYKTDVRLAHGLMRDRTVFIGNLDPSGVLALGTPDGSSPGEEAVVSRHLPDSR
jgi:uroporphyrinogen decarboxylase